jgi:hypothetical protein
MISRQELRKLARARIEDAEILCANGRYAGAVYLCGYAMELALKARICRTLKWPGFPETHAEMQPYRSFVVHSLEVLLHLSGVEAHIKSRHLTDWNIVAKWNPELRYQPVHQTHRLDATNMIRTTKTLTQVL